MDSDKPDQPPSLADLDARLKRARGEQAGADRPKTDGGKPSTSGLGMAMRVGVEMVSGVAVGAGIGYLLDSWLGTKPWLLILFFFLGAAAGILNVYRAATGEGLRMGYRDKAPKEDRPDVGP